ncbi:hypothetical protein F2Q68_00029687 [Brassica cretica]|uniref:Uncharacterized protein n=1 Tax=Brassica cretica TaxID=69181 RepID=A0A8S9GAY5_BRACR|nr:hypothetical protein F2Q68_00029687 [Brassica cretica]
MNEENEPTCATPAPRPRNPPSSHFTDISNFKTPRRPSVIKSNLGNTPQFFTASKQTPKSMSSTFRRPSLLPSHATRSKASASSRRLRAFELQQSQSSRKAELNKEKSLRSLAKSLTAWLNFLFENPESCGCEPLENGSAVGSVGNAKRDSCEALRSGKSVGVDTMWRSPKKSRTLGWCGEKGSDIGSSLSGSKYSTLRESLKEVCSLDDLKQRMQFHLSLGSCKEIFDAMTRVTKNIDEGRIKMKPQCLLVTDFGLKEKAVKALMCYNQVWLRLGLYIIFGGDSFLSDSEVNSDQEMAFLKMVINKQFFSHDGLARAFAYNKMVEGLYRPGYYEALGTVILKRILLLVLILDRAKSQSCISLKYGIDGIDGGSPLLFSEKSSIKSSHQLLSELLPADVMHGEGNLLAHLVIIGYKIPYQQVIIVKNSATKYSDKCCEELVAAGAIDKLLTLIRSASRSIPDQEVAKHALSTLRHLARYPQMADELIDTKGSIQTIFWELLRNKEEAYFVASDVLKKICKIHKGVEAVRKLPALVKRLHALVEELTRKANMEKRNVKGQSGKEKSERRLKEAVELMKLITSR